MPFVKVKIEEVIEQKCQQSESFKKNWDESKNRENMQRDYVNEKTQES